MAQSNENVQLFDIPGGKVAEVHYFLDWSYDDALHWMKDARARVLAGERWRIAVGSHAEDVVTLGAHTPDDQIQNSAVVEARRALVRRIERGGGATCHSPGQLVLYPVMSIRNPALSVPRFTNVLLETALVFLGNFGIAGLKDLKNPGVYVDNFKLASIGFRSQKGVVTHGLAINYLNDMAIFEAISPCGDPHQKMSSVKEILELKPGNRAVVPLSKAMKSLGSAFLRVYIEGLTE